MLLCFSIREVAQCHQSLEQELAHAVNASSKAMDVVYANSKASGVNEAATSHSAAFHGRLLDQRLRLRSLPLLTFSSVLPSSPASLPDSRL